MALRMGSQSFADFLKAFDAMPEDEKRAAVALADQECAGLKFVPNIGPQTEAYYCQADELFYGGAGGGGKTALLCGLAINEHHDIHIFRREGVQLRGIIKELSAILGSTDGLNAQLGIWRVPGTSQTIELAGIKDEDDKIDWQGRAADLKCVAAGTPVVMADGTLKAIEKVAVGDMVRTLSGPRRVTLLHWKKAHAVEVTARAGAVVSRQVQGSTHRLLTPAGWVAASDAPSGHCGRAEGAAGTNTRSDSARIPMTSGCQGSMPPRKSVRPHLRQVCSALAGAVAFPSLGGFSSARPSTCAPTVSDVARRCAEWFAGTFADRQMLGAAQASGRRHTAPPGLWLPGYQGSSATCVAVAPKDQGTGCAGIVGRTSEAVRRLSAFARLVRRSLAAASAEDGFAHWLRDRASRRAHDGPSLQGSTARCSSGSGHGGAQPRSSATVYLACPLQPSGAAGRSPRSSQGDGGGCTPGHSHPLRSYRHPYTTETRSAAEDVHVASLECRPVGEMVLFDLTVEDANHYITRGGFINQNCFDEITHFTRSQYEFIIGWNRSTRPGQRCRVVATGNPPIDENGLWVIQYWAPWLDDTHPDPAAPGELRYPVRATDDAEDTREIFFRTAAEGIAHLATFANPPRDLDGNIIPPRSRTFIPAKLEDNPDLMRSGYAAVLDKMPKELRDAMRDGKFKTAFVDDEFQVIPTEWIVAAQRRWTPERPRGSSMTAMGVDIAQGGADRTVMAPRYGSWFAPLITKPGRETPDGPTAAALIIVHMRDAAVVNIDLGGGWGGSAFDHLKANDAVALTGIVPGAGSAGRTADGRLHFKNIRAEMWWRFREALDPTSDCHIALPPDPELRSELAAPKWKIVGGNAVQIEDKAEIKKRLARSPDKGDAVVMAWFTGDQKKKRSEARARRWHDLPEMADLGGRSLHRHGSKPAYEAPSYNGSTRDEHGR